MRLMNSRQATAERPVSGRLARALEENGLLVIVLGAFAIVLVLSLRKQLVVDGWMAIVSGRWIVQHGLPSHDTLTLWAHGHRWIDQQWLAQLALYGLWRLGGLKLALLVHDVVQSARLMGDDTYYDMAELRTLYTEKNRNGPSGVETTYAMLANGLRAVELEENEGDE